MMFVNVELFLYAILPKLIYNLCHLQNSGINMRLVIYLFNSEMHVITINLINEFPKCQLNTSQEYKV